MKPAEVLEQMRRKKPVVHCIGNDISTRDTANLLLAAGARPVMSYAPQETEEISRHSHATVLNCGTPTQEKFDGLISAARGAQKHPLVIDPVGVGASHWRKENILKLLKSAKTDIIHCNFSEALVLLEESDTFSGVDSVESHAQTKIAAAQKLAQKYTCTVIITGEQDVVSDGGKTAVIYGGCKIMSLVSGSGCMLGGLLGAFAVAADSFSSAVAAGVFWKKRAEMAYAKIKTPGTFRTALCDSAFEITEADMEEIKVEYL